jgi:hypothetical protein
MTMERSPYPAMMLRRGQSPPRRGPGTGRWRAGMILPALLGAALLGTAVPAPATAQDANVLHPVSFIERTLRYDSLRILDWRGSRAVHDRTQRVILQLDDSEVMIAKWANAPPGGTAFNNEPRYEVAAYVLQTMFLEPHEYVVPPTLMRMLPLEFVRERIPLAEPTFPNAGSVLVVLQYWLQRVSQDNVWNARRAQNDTSYARHVGNLNLLTHLINHRDSNIGNVLISDGDPPRLFAVDNGVAFRSEESNRGSAWQSLRVRRLPATTVERLRALTREDLDRTLGVLVEYELRDGRYIEVEPGANLNPSRGVRNIGHRVQFGLTSAEIGDVERRLSSVLRSIERGQVTTF